MSTPSDKTLRLERTKLTPQPPRGGRNTTLIIAVVAGLAAAVLVGIWLNTQQGRTVVVQPAATPAPVAPATTPAVVATQDIPLGTVIQAGMVKSQQVKASDLVPNAVASTVDVVGRAALTPIKSGDQIRGEAVGPNTPPFTGMAAMFKPPYRAMTIALDSNSSVAGFLKPGDHVDVIGTFTVDNRTITRTILQNVTLLATGTQVLQTTPDPNASNNNGLLTSNNDGPQPTPQPAKPTEIPNATVEVTPIDAEKLILAANKGKLMLILRSNVDNNQSVVPTIDESVVTTIKTAQAAPARPAPPPPAPVLPPVRPAAPILPPPPPPSVTVIRGSTLTTQTVAPTGA